MTRRLLCLICVAASLPVSAALAQTPPVPPTAPAKRAAPDLSENPPLDANYVVTLASADGKGPDISVLVAAQKFSVFTSPVNFNGELIPQENSAFLLYYILEQNHTVTKSTIWLRPGEPVQIIKGGDQFYNLKLDRYHPTEQTKGSPASAAAGQGTPGSIR